MLAAARASEHDGSVSNGHQREKTILWIDPFITHSDPSTRHLLHALPRLQAAGWSVSVWCLRSDAPRDTVRHTFIPAPPLPGSLLMIYFAAVMTLCALWRWIRRMPPPADVVQSTCGMYWGAPVAMVQFVNCVWLRRQLALGFSSAREFLQFWLHVCGAFFERLHWRGPALRVALPVSDSIGEEVRRRTRASVQIETLPNSYDETRFNPAVRGQWRAVMRGELGFADSDVVFAFASLGHHKRKGFWLAVEALAQLRSDPKMRHAKFLVIGGRPETLAALQRKLDKCAPDWREWIVLTGHQTGVEKHLSAADAFLYPSYFEAFCLAEIEAAALGVPLLLTRHHGSEMILEDGVNGLWLEFDASAITETLRHFMAMPPGTFRRSVGRALDRTQYSEHLLGIYERIHRHSAPASAGKIS